MQILVKIGGYRFSEADIIRRAMSKKKRDVIESEKENFKQRAVKNGYRLEVADKLYALILRFADYGFPKAHSVSYSLIGYQMAYLKCYYKEYFIAHLLNSNINSEAKTREYLAVAKRMNINIKKPDINESSLEYVIKDNELILPLNIIKNLGEESARNIVKIREEIGEYKDFFQFVGKTYGKGVNKKVIESLIYAGALDTFGYNHETLIKNIDSAINYGNLIADLDEEYVLKPVIEVVVDENKEYNARNKELDIYGFYISNHPSMKYIDESIMKLINIKNYFDKQIKCVVMIEKIKKIKTKKNEEMAFVTVSDETENADVTVFNSNMNLINDLKNNDLVVIIGRVNKRFDQYNIILNSIEKVNEGISNAR